jgi:hypothetical protein
MSSKHGKRKEEVMEGKSLIGFSHDRAIVGGGG